MASREEIREGMFRAYLKFQRPGSSHHRFLIDHLLEYLHSKGVVRKVGGELPSIFDADENMLSALEYKKKLAGYFEPLIEV